MVPFHNGSNGCFFSSRVSVEGSPICVREIPIPVVLDRGELLKEGPRHFHHATFGTFRLVEEVPLYLLTRFGPARFNLVRLGPPQYGLGRFGSARFGAEAACFRAHIRSSMD